MHSLAERCYGDVIEVGWQAAKLTETLCGKRNVLTDLVLCGGSQSWEGSDELAKMTWALGKWPGSTMECRWLPHPP